MLRPRHAGPLQFRGEIFFASMRAACDMHTLFFICHCPGTPTPVSAQAVVAADEAWG
jgi:hypothetical protein